MQTFLVTTAFGLEELLLQEVKELLPEVKSRLKPGQVFFEGNIADAYRLCLWSRLANRVLLQLHQDKIRNADELYHVAKSVEWHKHFSNKHTFAVDFFGTNREIKNTQFGALKIKDAIVDQFKTLSGVRPNVDKTEPNIRIQARLHREQVALFLDLSGASLHQRHYRLQKGRAPIRENLAFAMLMRSGWTKDTDATFVDPMCGSGTIAIEAALYKANIAPGLNRETWGFSYWSGHSEKIWHALVKEAKDAKKDDVSGIYANDIDKKLINVARQNAQQAGVASYIQFSSKDATHFSLIDQSPGYLVCNTPYGERLGELTTLIPLFQTWGVQLKQKFADWKLALLTSNRDLFKQLRLVSQKAYKFKNANLDCELLTYNMDSRNCQVMESANGQQGDFANRLKKNVQKSKRWLKNINSNCYRIYDADLPDYNVAIDCYADWVVVQEYAAPKEIPQHKTIRRLHEVLACLPEILSVEAEKIVLKVREVKKGKAQYEKIDKGSSLLEVQENGASFLVNLHDYLDTGLFLDHRKTRQLVKENSKSKQVLNLFSYTGSVSVFAALGGAKSVTTVDMSNTYLDWAKKNFAVNNLKWGHHFIKADCTTWLQEHKEKYDLIFIDPPSFSNSKSMTGTWDVQRDHMQLLADAKSCLTPKGMIIFSNNLRSFKLDPNLPEKLDVTVTDVSKDTIPEDFERNQKIHQCWLIAANN